MKDRLNSLYRHSPRQIEVVLDEVEDDLLDESFNSKTDAFLQEILVQRQAVSLLRHAVDRVSQLHRLLLAALDSNSGPDIDCVNEMVKTLDKLFKEVDGSSASICKTVNDLKFTANQDCDSPADYRIRKDQLMGLTESLRLLLLRFNRDYVHYEEASRQRAVDYSDKNSEAERVLEFLGTEEGGVRHDESARDIAMRSQLVRTVSAFEVVLQEVRERHETMERVEQSIEDLGRMFDELRVYVDNGGESANCIEQNIEKAGEYVEKTRVETGFAIQKEDIESAKRWIGRGARKLRLIMLVLVLFLSLLLLVLFLIFLRVGLRL